MFGSSRMSAASSSTTGNSEPTMSASIKQEVIDGDSPTSDSGEAAAVAAAAAAAAAVVQRHFRLGLSSSPSVAGRRSALGYSATGAGPRSARINSTTQPETCVCEVCQVELGRYEALFCHKLLHFNSGNVCYVCDLYFAGGADELRLHVATHHRDIAGLHPKASDTAFVCSVCVQRFSTSKALMRHQAQLHNPAIYSSPINAARRVTCAICTVDFSNERELLSHLLGAQHKDMKSIFICIDCRSIFSNRDAYAFHMMTRAQNETCDVISAAATAASAVEAGSRTDSQNGDVVSTDRHQHAQQQSNDRISSSSSSSPHTRNHRQTSVDGRRALTDGGGRPARYASDRQATVRAAAAAAGTLGAHRFDEGIGRRWLTGRARNVSHGATTANAAPLDKKSKIVASPVAECGSTVPAPLNLTCQTTERRSTTTASQDESCRHDVNRDRNDWLLGRRTADPTDKWPPINVVGVTQRRSMSARTDADERPTKVRRRTCWSVDNITTDFRSRQLSEPVLLNQPSYDDAVQRVQRSYPSPGINGHRQNDATSWDGARSSAEFIDYCNDVATIKQRMQTSSTSLGVQENIRLEEAVPDRLAVEQTWSRVQYDGELRPGGGGSGREGPSRECSAVSQEPLVTEDDDDDALRQLLRLIQQPDGQPVFLCRHCDIIYADRMLYALHMGLHNVNNPWQCNICGTTCSGRQQFALHALHY